MINLTYVALLFNVKWLSYQCTLDKKIPNPVVGWLEWLYLNVQKETVEERISQSSMKYEVPLCKNIVGRVMVKPLRHKVSLTLQFIKGTNIFSCINFIISSDSKWNREIWLSLKHLHFRCFDLLSKDRFLVRLNSVT